MSDDTLHSARLHLSQAAELAGTMAEGFAMKRLRKALNRCTPITQNPGPASYAENPFEGGNVGAPPQSPQYSVGSCPEGRPVESNFVPPPLPVTEYPGDTIPGAYPDPCQGMRDKLAQAAIDYAQGRKGRGPGGGQFTSGNDDKSGSRPSYTDEFGRDVFDDHDTPYPQDDGPSQDSGPDSDFDPDNFSRSTYCPSFMGQPTGEVPPLAGQPLDTYDSFTNQPANTLFDPNRSLNDTLRQLWLRNAVGQSAQMPYSYPQNPDGRAQGPMTEVPQDDFLGGRFGPGIRRMRESLARCRM